MREIKKSVFNYYMKHINRFCYIPDYKNGIIYGGQVKYYEEDSKTIEILLVNALICNIGADTTEGTTNIPELYIRLPKNEPMIIEFGKEVGDSSDNS